MFSMHRVMLAVSMAMAIAWISGCSGGLAEVRSADRLERIIATSDAPVLVEYYKGGCGNCGALEVALGHIVREQAGQVKAFKFMLAEPTGEVICEQLAERHEILFYPTVVLYVAGRERKRFVQHYIYGDYELAIQQSLSTGSEER